MDTQNQNFKMRLGIFVIVGVLILFLGIFVIGKQKKPVQSGFRVNS